MASIESRIERLEDCTTSGNTAVHVPGVRTVKFAPIFRREGFRLEELDAPQPTAPLQSNEPVKFRPISEARTRKLRLEDELAEKLKGLDRAAQVKLAKQHGYRVIYRNGPWADL